MNEIREMDESNQKNSPVARTLKRKKRIVKKLIEINEDGT
jgi:hypothetical protein